MGACFRLPLVWLVYIFFLRARLCFFALFFFLPADFVFRPVSKFKISFVIGLPFKTMCFSYYVLLVGFCAAPPLPDGFTGCAGFCTGLLCPGRDAPPSFAIPLRPAPLVIGFPLRTISTP